jgi:tRNA dimethylallyltransferase
MTARDKPTVIAIVGPTASGKTAVSLALAEELGAEIIACDSRTVYREFDIGTAKPSAAERTRVRHYAIDVADPLEDYTVNDFVEEATKAINEINTSGKIPIITGGTGFYARALLQGLSLPPVSPQKELRAQLEQLADAEGNAALYARLQELDPKTAAKLHVNDRFRIIRALEVQSVTGMPMSQAATRVDPPFHTIWVGLTANDRSVLHKSIELRMNEQVENGLVEETERLYTRYGAHQKLLATVNYKQLVAFLEGKLSRAEALQQAIHNNVQLARRQLIWFRANSEIAWFAIDALSRADLRQSIAAHIKGALSA